MEHAYADYIPLFKAITDETRLKIIRMVARGEICACEMLESLQITQPTLSYHMKLLTECGLVEGRRDGPWVRYTMNREKSKAVRDFWDSITAGSGES